MKISLVLAVTIATAAALGSFSHSASAQVQLTPEQMSKLGAILQAAPPGSKPDVAALAQRIVVQDAMKAASSPSGSTSAASVSSASRPAPPPALTAAQEAAVKAEIQKVLQAHATAGTKLSPLEMEKILGAMAHLPSLTAQEKADIVARLTALGNTIPAPKSAKGTGASTSTAPQPLTTVSSTGFKTLTK